MRLAVLIEEEVVFGEGVDEAAVLVSNGGEEIDGADVDGDGRSLLGDEWRNMEVKEGNEAEQGRQIVRIKSGSRHVATPGWVGWRVRRIERIAHKRWGRAGLPLESLDAIVRKPSPCIVALVG